jgi:ABC-2 type transport system permease protein
MAYFSYLNNFTWGTPKAYIPVKVLNPILQVMFFATIFDYIGGQPRSYYLLGNAIHNVCLCSIFGVAVCMEGDRIEGTFAQIVLTPVRWIPFFASRVFLHLLDGLFASAVSLAFVALAFDLSLAKADAVALALSIVCAVMSSSGIGFLIGSLGFYVRDMVVMANIANYATVVLCGANFPITNMPAPLQHVAYGLPLTRSIAAARAAVDGAGVFEVLPLLVADLSIGVAYALVGVVIFHVTQWLYRHNDTVHAFP